MTVVYHIYVTDYFDDFVKFKRISNLEFFTKQQALLHLHTIIDKVSGSYYKIEKVFK